MKTEKCRICGSENLQKMGSQIICADCGRIFDAEDESNPKSFNNEARKKWVFRGVILLIAILSLVILELTTHFISNFLNYLWRGK